MKKRLLSLLLTICLVAGLVPTVVIAADGDKAIMSGTSGIKDPTATPDDQRTYYVPNSYIYFGVNGGTPIKWRVLNADKANDESTNGVFLLSEYLLASGIASNQDGSANEGQQSYAQEWCKNFASNLSNFSQTEQSAMLGVAKTDSEESLYGREWGESSLTREDKMFFLSARELFDYVANFSYTYLLQATFIGSESDLWGLRSPVRENNSHVGVVSTFGEVLNSSFTGYESFAARPAFNLDPNSVLFTSAAEGGKSADGMDSGLTAIGNYEGNEWKLTILDESRNFGVTEQTAVGIPGDTITLNYTAATVGTNEYISAIIADESGIQYYGRVMQPSTENGTVNVTIPSGLAAGKYTLNVFSEQYNGDYKTDYASEFEQITLTVEEVPAPKQDKAITLGTNGIKDPTAEGNTYYIPNSYIYFGVNDGTPIKWRVLDADKANDNSTDGIFLLSEYLLSSGVYFNKEKTSNFWQNSDAQEWCKTFASDLSNFSESEQSAMLGVEKTDDWDYLLTFTLRNGSLTSEEKMFFLSARELYDYVATYYSGAPGLAATFYGDDNYNYSWWLRSRESTNLTDAILIHTNKWSIWPVDTRWCARPAFNLNPDSLLFASAADGGKAPGIIGTLSAVSDYNGNEWKLTLLDSNRSSFSANVNGESSVSTSAGGSVEITYSGAKTGENEYVSAMLCDRFDNDVLYYGNIANNSQNGIATLNIPSGLADGKYKLKVFSEQCNGDYITDYASAFQEISMTVRTLPKEETPNASFIATGDNGGTLSGVDTSMKYSVDGGESWTDIVGTTMEITGVTANDDIQVIKKGNGTTTSDSEAQTIDVTQAETPTEIGKIDCTASGANDGTITNVDSTMEYRLSTVFDWTDITGTEVTGLGNGTYEVRVKANRAVLASAPATVTIGEHTCVAQEGWKSDGNYHWKECECGTELEKTAHSGGKATCTASAVCDVCGQPYGSVDSTNHTGSEAWTTTETSHTKVWSCCQAVIDGPAEHTWENGECTVCGYPCQHTGGTATCSQLAQCERCGTLYGDYDETNHDPADEWTQENGKHYHICQYGCGTHLDEADCSGGTATCTEPATCDVCGNAYGNALGHDFSGNFDAYDEDGHWHICNRDGCNETDTPQSHSFTTYSTNNDATCTDDGTETAKCDYCEATDTRTDAGSATGHDWDEPVWSWSQDGKTCTVTFTCQNDSSHTEQPEVNVTSEVTVPATCTDDGTTTYTASIELNGQTYKDSKDVADNPATGHKLTKIEFKAATCTEEGYTGDEVCKVCGEVVEQGKTIPKLAHNYQDGRCSECGAIDGDFQPVIIAGANGEWQKGTKDGLSFTSNAAFADFLKVQIDGKDLDASNYDVEEGSTIVTLKASYLETLSVGKHTLAIVSETGTAATEFTVKAASASDDTQPPQTGDDQTGDSDNSGTSTGDTVSPQTGDSSNVVLWVSLLFASGVGLFGAAVYSRKRKYSK